MLGYLGYLNYPKNLFPPTPMGLPYRRFESIKTALRYAFKGAYIQNFALKKHGPSIYMHAKNGKSRA